MNEQLVKEACEEFVDINKVKEYLPDSTNDEKQASLMCAVKNVNLCLAQTLLQAGADPNKPSILDISVLSNAVLDDMLSVSDNKKNMIRLLLSYDGDWSKVPEQLRNVYHDLFVPVSAIMATIGVSIRNHRLVNMFVDLRKIEPVINSDLVDYKSTIDEMCAFSESCIQPDYCQQDALMNNQEQEVILAQSQSLA